MNKKLIYAAIEGRKISEGYSYLFNNEEYIKYDWTTFKATPESPLKLSAWKLPEAFSQGIDAVINGENVFEDYAYFFKGNRYVKFDWTNNKAVDGYPKPITVWKLPARFSNGLDAAFSGHGAHQGFGYLIKGGEYVKYDWTTDSPVLDYPKSIADWDLPSHFLLGIDAAINGEGRFKNNLYFFKDNEVVKYDWNTGKCSNLMELRRPWGLLDIWLNAPNGNGQIDDTYSNQEQNVQPSELRAAVLEQMQYWNGATEGDNGKFDKEFLPPPALENARKSAGKMGWVHTTCIDFQTRALALAAKETFGEASFGKVAKVGGTNAKQKALEMGAWNEASANMVERPTPGDIFILTKKENGWFSHIGYIKSIVKNDDGTETWQTIDGGQGQAGKYSKEGALLQKGQEMIKTVTRIYVPKENIITGERNQDNRQRVLQGWVNVDKLKP